MIESIQIKNFRGIQEGQIDRFSKFNLLVGPNNSGKSAVLEMLYLASTASREASLVVLPLPEEYSVRISDRDFLGDDPFPRVLARHSYTEPQDRLDQGTLYKSVSAPSSPIQTFTLNAHPRAQAEDSSIALWSKKTEGIVRDMVKKDIKYPLMDFARWLFGDEVDKPEFSVERQMGYCWNLTYNQTGSAAWVVKGKLPTAQHTLFYDVFNTLGHLPMNFFRRMIKTVPGWSQKIARSFGQVLGLDQPFNVQFFPVDQQQLWTQGWIAPEDKIALTIDSYGDGARSIFKVLTPLLALAELAREDAPGLFIWEEPESFQNPQTLGRLLAEVVALIKDKPIQLFIATHSLEVLAHFADLAQKEKIKADDLMAFRLDLRDGKLSSSWFNADNLTAWLEDGLDPRVWGDFRPPLAFHFSGGAGMTPSLDFFGEGATEEKILAKLGLPTLRKKEPVAGGKAEINKRMADVLGPDLGRRPIRCLVMRDVDSHVGETVDRVKLSIEDALRRLFRERGFDSDCVSLQPLQKRPNVYTYQSSAPDIRIALHIADYRYSDQFIKSTVDDYVLKLAMRPATAKALLQEKRKNGWKITASQLISKIGRTYAAQLNGSSNGGLPWHLLTK